MKENPAIRLFFFYLFFCYFIISDKLFADDDNFDDRSRHINKRNERFFKNRTTRNFVSASGEYKSSESTKQYNFSIDHFFKNQYWISDIELQSKTTYEATSSSKKERVKKSDLNKAIISEKIRIFDSNNYFILFNESRYDNEADISYYDIVTSAGFGRSFFNDSFEIDCSYGIAKAKDINSISHNSTKTRFDYQRDVITTSFRSEFILFDNIKYVQRGYAYFSGDIDSYYLNSRLLYPINKKLYLQISHIFNKRTYEKYNKSNIPIYKINEIDRQLYLGFRFDFSN